MNRLASLYRNTIGKKIIVAVTGVTMLGFLFGHVSGNLKAFLPDTEAGSPDIDAYASFLRQLGEPLLPHGAALWFVRFVLLVALGFHVSCVIQLARRNRVARPVSYGKRRYVQSTLAARWMMFSGLLLLAFFVFHILHFTTGDIAPESFEEGAVYANLYRAFSSWPFVLFYIASMALVGFHLYHGLWSLFQTLGFDSPDRNRGLRRIAMFLAVVLFIGFASVPLAFWSGRLKEPSTKVNSMHTERIGEDR